MRLVGSCGHDQDPGSKAGHVSERMTASSTRDKEILTSENSAYLMVKRVNGFDWFTVVGENSPTEFHETSDHHTFKKMLPCDERRFKPADLDGDQTATREEFTTFLPPEEFEHMKEIVVRETLEDLNKNGDGLVYQDEYIADMFSHEENGPEPDWVLSEREQFNEF
ncbi:hypothetical protein EI555_012693 [Monodon monoceros]|uniref:Reticulocalbin-3 n=1 Tax=Monodon monoceros TaxID=40151 RepID=A0A4U1ETQ1_MONMO|nr:hypothetical protein EI555_012693 [Monodon monoceros]